MNCAVPAPELRHLAHWPHGQSQHLTLPRTHLFHNVEVSAARYPDKPFVLFYDSVLTFAEFRVQAERIAGYLQQDCGVQPGDRVLLDMQNSPQWIWPAEVEALMYHHPAVQEACAIGARDARSGETVKALVVLKAGVEPPTADALMAWCHEHMAAYKVPRLVEFVPALPRSGSGKVMWRELQEQQDARDAAASRA